jgi:hypothetical protein
VLSGLLHLVVSPGAPAQVLSWELAGGSERVQVSSITAYRNNADSMYAAGGTGLLLSTDGGMHWDSVATGICCGVIEVDPSDPHRLFLNETGLPEKGNAIHRSSDGGSVWTLVEHGDCSKLKGCASALITVDPVEPSTLYFSLNPAFVLKGTAGGNAWDTIPAPQVLNLQSLQISPADHDVFYAAYGKPIAVFRSTDGASSWQYMGSPTPGAETRIRLAVDPLNPDLVYAGVSGYGMFRSENGGSGWAQINQGLPDGGPDILAILINPHNPEEIFVGLSDDDPFDGESDLVYVSVNGGAEWSSLTPGLPPYGAVSWLLSDPDEFRILAAVSSTLDTLDRSGIYVLSSGTGVEPAGAHIPGETATLFQNYPNPFNGFSNIRFRVPEHRSGGPVTIRVHLTVYDILGRRVAELLNESLSPGTYSVRWDAGALPGGVYFCRLETEGVVQTRRMVLLK